ncbi:MAG: chemotaxis protein CheD [candidate division Zixibacteria bacterium]|nr:chemotaxis protein CheD [candidate division Zixibacteria bacterium]
MSISYIGRGDIAISNTKTDIIKTMSLASCVGVMLYDKELETVAIGHVTLPNSSVRSGNDGGKPARYADTGILLLVKALMKMGSKGGKSIVAKIVGGAQLEDENKTLNLGDRNVAAVKNILTKCGLSVLAEDTGKEITRVMEVNVGNGEIILSTPGKPKWKI